MLFVFSFRTVISILVLVSISLLLLIVWVIIPLSTAFLFVWSFLFLLLGQREVAEDAAVVPHDDLALHRRGVDPGHGQREPQQLGPVVDPAVREAGGEGAAHGARVKC